MTTLLILTLALARQEIPVTLHVGDKAPPVIVGKWLKGKPLADFTDGKIHVIEFWATWCGPCKAAMPHLSKLAKQYKGTIVFTGISIGETKKTGIDTSEKVERFVKGSGDVMDYSVAADGSANVMLNTWFYAAGQHGIPRSFVVDKAGRIAAILTPWALDEILPEVMEGKFNQEAWEAKARARLGNHQEGVKESPSHKYAALLKTDQTLAHAFGIKLIIKLENDPLGLSQFAETVLKQENPFYPLAIQALKTAIQHTDPLDPDINELLASAYFRSGDPKNAVEAQERVVKYYDIEKALPDAYVKEHGDEARRKLEAYKAAAAKL